MRILYDNIVTLSTTVLSATTESANYPIANLKDPRQTRKFRTTSHDAQTITINPTATETATYMVIAGHNLTDAADVQFNGDGVLIQDNIPVANVIVISFASDTFDIFTLVIDDPTNTSDFIELSYIFVGTYLQMPGMKPGQSLPRVTTSQSSVSSGGQAYGSGGYMFRQFGVEFPFMTDTQRKAVDTCFDAVENYTPFIMLPWANDLVFETPMYCRFDMDSIPWKRNDNHNDPWGCNLKFREVF